MKLLTALALALALLAGCSSSPEAPPDEAVLPEDFDIKEFEENLARAPRCSEVRFMVAEIASLGCLSDDGGTIFAFADFGCGAYSDHGGGLYGEEYEVGAAFSGCP